jgi:hypothetical protein
MADLELHNEIEEHSRTHRLIDIYDPDNPEGSGNVVPSVGSVLTSGSRIYVVTAVNSVTYKTTYVQATIVVTDEDAGDQVSIVSYGNDYFCLYTDDRNSPTRLQPDTRLVITGRSPARYRLIINKGTPNEKVISKYYGSNGEELSDYVPMLQILTSDNQPSGNSYAFPCHTSDILTEGQEVHMVIYNDHGASVAEVNLFVKNSAILNETPGFRPRITGLKVTSPHTRSNGEIFIFETQDPDSLNMQLYVTYNDGNEQPVDIDNQKTFVFNLERFIASYAGMTQEVLFKYYLSNTEELAPGVTPEPGSFISIRVPIIVVPNELGVTAKVSVQPRWSQSASQWLLKYYLYTTDRDTMIDVTPHTTITEGSFSGTSSYMGIWQEFEIAVDMMAAIPSQYSVPLMHRQPVAVRLQNISIYERYLLRDGMGSPVIYGVDSQTSNRPILMYDTSLERYFIPTSIFETKDEFLNSFYFKASPPYLSDTEDLPPTPTHFTVRDMSNGMMIISDPISVDDYNQAFSVIGTPKDRFTGSASNVTFEFIYRQDASTDLILYGVPVDVRVSEAGYQG